MTRDWNWNRNRSISNAAQNFFENSLKEYGTVHLYLQVRNEDMSRRKKKSRLKIPVLKIVNFLSISFLGLLFLIVH